MELTCGPSVGWGVRMGQKWEGAVWTLLPCPYTISLAISFLSVLPSVPN